jgi:hypothetical protein
MAVTRSEATQVFAEHLRHTRIDLAPARLPDQPSVVPPTRRSLDA